MKVISSMLLVLALVCVVGCNKEEEPNNGGGNENNDIEVRVTTFTPQDISYTSAKFGAEVEVIGAEDILPSELGVCWSTEENPVPVYDYVSTTVCDEPFVCAITSLTPNTVYHVRAYAVCGHKYYYGEAKVFTTLESSLESSGNLNGHDYIDLGLPSGTLWATLNVGANTIVDYGYYFAWGETQPKSDYNWSTYRYCHGEGDMLTKYCNDSFLGYNGFTDSLTNLQPEDDAATANWGAGWRMPSQEEWQELISNTVGKGVMVNNVEGWLLTATNGNSLFLPFAGYRSYITLFKAGKSSFSWTTSLHDGYSGYACPAICCPADSYLYNMYRYCGLTVRPVCSMEKN